MDLYNKCKNFIYKNARPLDLMRWQYHFENGNKENVLKALKYYQNEDGGFGNALELDCWNPNSAPIQTWTACEIIEELNIDSSNEIVQGILKYLSSGKDFVNGQWFNTIPSNNFYPRAIWWSCENDVGIPSENPTVYFAGFIIKYANKDSLIFSLACDIAKKNIKELLNKNMFNEMHILACYIHLYNFLKEAKVDFIDFKKFSNKLQELVKYNITADPEKWKDNYVTRPSQFFNSPNSFLYSGNKEIADYECRFINETQLEDGSYLIPWQWYTEYSKEYELSINWWKSIAIINNIMYLKNFDKL